MSGRKARARFAQAPDMSMQTCLIRFRYRFRRLSKPFSASAPLPSPTYRATPALSERTEATGDPFAPPVRLSAPAGHGRLAPPLRATSSSPDEAASRGAHGRSRGQGGRGKRRAEPRRVFRGPTGRATRRFTSAVSGGSAGRAPGSPRRGPVGGRPRKTSERTAARSAPFFHTDCRAETQIPPKPRFTRPQGQPPVSRRGRPSRGRRRGPCPSRA